MIPRFLTKYALRDEEYYPAITITGPRQSGKTTLARATFPDYSYVSLEETELFLLPPHHRNFNKRIIKGPKLYFHDTGLACQLLVRCLVSSLLNFGNLT